MDASTFCLVAAVITFTATLYVHLNTQEEPTPKDDEESVINVLK